MTDGRTVLVVNARARSGDRELARGRHVEDPCVLHAQASRVSLRTEPRLELDVDGELDGRTPVEFRVDPGALRVLAPARTR